LSDEETTTEQKRQENDRVIRDVVNNQNLQDNNFRTNLQGIMNMQNGQDMNPLLALILVLFLGPDFKDALLENTESRARDYSDNSSTYGSITRRTPAADGSSTATFSPVDKFPAEVTFTRAYQEEGGLNRIFEGKDADGNDVTIVKARDNSREGTRSWANNNPGNLRYSEWEREYGAIGSDKDGFAIFESVDAGLEAQKHLLQSDNYANLTLREAVYRYAPQHENDSESYVRQVSQATGIASNRTLNTLNEDEQNRLVRAMVNHEGWKEARVLTQNSDGTTTPTTTPNSNTAVASAYTSNGAGLMVAKPLGDGQLITSDFGPRNLSMSSMHRGIDLKTKHLDPNGNVELYARQPMVITDISENRGGYGYRVSAAIGKDDSGRAITVQYSHLDSLPQHIKIGDTLKAGDYIATTGHSGRGTGAHLDFEVRIGDQVVDPEKAFTTDLANSRNGDTLVAQAQSTLGSKAHSGTYASRIAPSLQKSSVMSAVNALDATREANPRILAFNSGGVVENDPQQPEPLTSSFDGKGVDQVALAESLKVPDLTVDDPTLTRSLTA
tara:strand:+ start:3510 stop:5177 length:1668 start_codon:yes stop_codon:yes gene_type:complete